MTSKLTNPISMRWLWALLIGVLLQLGAVSGAQAQQPGADFDHSATGFILNAQHQSVRCETCHIKGVFKGTPKDCASCHGWNNPRSSIVMPTNHIPTAGANCDVCHTAMTAQFVDATRVFSHAVVVGQSCESCHSSNNPIPNVTPNPTDAVHLSALQKHTPCSTCHASTVAFAATKVPANHIPTAAVSCTSCHGNGDFATMPSLTAIHANAQSTSNNCAQCHSSANAAAYAMPTMVPPLVGPPSNHIALNGQSCETCHVGAGSSITATPVQDGAKFSNSMYSHAGVSSGCASCHGPNVGSGTFYGVTGIVVMPSTALGGHIPTTTTCETCHTGSMPGGFVSVTAARPVPGSAFQNSPPSTGQIHSGTAGACSTCHEAGMNWLDMDLPCMPGCRQSTRVSRQICIPVFRPAR